MFKTFTSFEPNEYVEPNALKECKVSNFKIVDQRIKFYHKIPTFYPLNLNPLFDI